MNEKTFYKTRLYVTAIVSVAIWSLLAWNYYHGGVPSHHILAREDMPSISNWWGGVLLPLLTWFLLYRIEKRITSENSTLTQFPKSVVYAFVIALLFGVLLSTFFTLRYSDIPGFMLLSVFVIALFLPVYRAECLLGFVVGMTFTFGAVLPTGVGAILVVITFVLYWLARKLIYFARGFSDSNRNIR
jgi:hypothetical protein